MLGQFDGSHTFRRLTDRASAATDSADRQRYATEISMPECYRIQERSAVCRQLQALVRPQVPKGLLHLGAT
jgi:hypothetical protein